MTYRHALFAMVAAGAFGLAACESDNVGPASSGSATAGAPNGASQGSDSSGKPVNSRPPPETPPVAPGGP